MIDDKCWDEMSNLRRSQVNTKIHGVSSKSWILRIPQCPRQIYRAITVAGKQR